jgi:hypothetical protein
MTAAGGMAGPAPADLAARAADRVLAGLADDAQPGVVVDAPPGAGKSALVVRAVASLAGAGEQVMAVAQTNGQVDDLTSRLALAAPGLAIGRLCGQDYVPTPTVTRHETVSLSSRASDLAGCAVVAGTAAKWATVTQGWWPWAVVDEAYQMRSDMLLQIAGRFGRALFVGDPGQLDPFSRLRSNGGLA